MTFYPVSTVIVYCIPDWNPPGPMCVEVARSVMVRVESPQFAILESRRGDSAQPPFSGGGFHSARQKWGHHWILQIYRVSLDRFWSTNLGKIILLKQEYCTILRQSDQKLNLG